MANRPPCVPSYLWPLYLPLDGVRSMLELGNKKGPDGVYKDAFTALGIAHTSVDLNGMDGALSLDLRWPLRLGQFDMVTNIGTSEHVNEQEPCWRNMHDAVSEGGWLLSMTPYPGDWGWHGEYHPREAFYRDFAALNGYDLERLYVVRQPPHRNWCCRLRKLTAEPFTMPPTATIFRNK